MISGADFYEMIIMERPKNVQFAVGLLSATLVLGSIIAFIDFKTFVGLAQHAGGARFVIFVQLFVLAFTLFYIYFIANRKNWARILYLVLYLIGVPFSVKPLIESLEARPTSGLITLLQMACQTIAAILLFMPESNDWFKKRTD